MAGFDVDDKLSTIVNNRQNKFRYKPLIINLNTTRTDYLRNDQEKGNARVSGRPL